MSIISSENLEWRTDSITPPTWSKTPALCAIDTSFHVGGNLLPNVWPPKDSLGVRCRLLSRLQFHVHPKEKTQTKGFHPVSVREIDDVIPAGYERSPDWQSSMLEDEESKKWMKKSVSADRYAAFPSSKKASKTTLSSLLHQALFFMEGDY